MLFMAFTLALVYGQELTTEQLQFDGLNRTYLKYIPAGFDANSSLPLVMSFHGGASNSSDQLAIADLRSLADQDQFILLYPDAYPEPLAGETNWQVVVSGDLPFTDPTAHDDIGFVDALIDEMHAAHGRGARHLGVLVWIFPRYVHGRVNNPYLFNATDVCGDRHCDTLSVSPSCEMGQLHQRRARRL